MAQDPGARTTPRQPRRLVFGALALAVLGLHGQLLVDLGSARGALRDRARAPEPPARPALQIRPMVLTVPAPRPATAPPARRRPPAAALAPATATAPDAADGSPLAPPVYPTRLPAADRLHFETRRVASTGDAWLDWQPGAAADGCYQLRLQIDGPGRGQRVLHSEGGVDAAGLAPRRFTDARRPGATLAANFERAAGRIRYSGPAVEFALLAGAQDGLSWWVQLAAIVEANPDLGRRGAHVVLFVSGARGDAGVWHFEALGPERLRLAQGEEITATRLQRAADRPWGLAVDVWLDPLRGHLPARLHLRTPAGGDMLDLRRH